MMRLAVALVLPSLACIEETGRSDTVDTFEATAGPPETSTPVDDGADGDSDAEPCDTNGVTRCAPEANATELCSDGVWIQATCADDRICVEVGAGAQCIPSSGEGGCRGAFYCFLTCSLVHPDDDEAAQDCFVECYVSATQAAQRELSDVLACFEDNCDAVDPIGCAAERCSQDLADCYFDSKGDAPCALIVECRLACGDDQACAQGCGADATLEAQGDYAVLELCTFYACAGQDDDCPRRASLPTGVCGPYANACIGLLPNTPR